MIDQEFLRERYDYCDGHLIARYHISPRLRKGDKVGYITQRGYRRTKVCNTRHYLHRLIYIWHHGEIQHEIDHINNDTSDNRIENLRDIPHSDNQLNRRDTKRRGIIRREWLKTDEGKAFRRKKYHDRRRQAKGDKDP